MKVSLSKGTLEGFGRTIRISSRVRNEENKLRSLNEKPVLSIPNEKPVMPRPFPAGKWEVYRPQARNTRELAPFFIPTNAYRRLPVWTVVDGHYGEATSEITIDRGYGIHFSEYLNTIGCIKVHEKSELLWLVEQITDILDKGEKVYLEVEA